MKKQRDPSGSLEATRTKGSDTPIHALEKFDFALLRQLLLPGNKSTERRCGGGVVSLPNGDNVLRATTIKKACSRSSLPRRPHRAQKELY